MPYGLVRTAELLQLLAQLDHEEKMALVEVMKIAVAAKASAACQPLEILKGGLAALASSRRPASEVPQSEDRD